MKILLNKLLLVLTWVVDNANEEIGLGLAIGDEDDEGLVNHDRRFMIRGG